MTIQQREVKTQYGVIYYTLYRKKVKNLNLRIKTDGTVHISAGTRVTIKEIERVLQEKSQWIISRIEGQCSKSLDKGTLYLWGKPLQKRFILCGSEEQERCVLEGDAAIFFLHNPMDEQPRKELWLMLIKQEAQRVFIPLFELWSERFSKKYGTEKQRLIIRPMTSRWGSRSKRTGRITLNLYLAGKPREYLEYTIVHELCHLLRMDHSRQFYQLVEENLPGAYLIHQKMRHESPE